MLKFWGVLEVQLVILISLFSQLLTFMNISLIILKTPMIHQVFHSSSVKWRRNICSYPVLFVYHWGLQLHNYILLAILTIQSVVTRWLFLYQLQRWWDFTNCFGRMVSSILYIPTKPFWPCLRLAPNSHTFSHQY